MMNSTSIIPSTLSFLFVFIFIFRDVYAVPTRHLCHPKQRDSLLSFKNEFEIGEPADCLICDRKTESWAKNSDCCNWKGITCNAKSGEVIKVDLRCSCLHGWFQSNSSLQNLHFLTTLDLSYNVFSGQIQSLIGNLFHLTTLDLSYNQFSDQIPSSIENLSHLTTLHLSHNKFSGQIPSSIGNLSLLTTLALSHNLFSGQIPSSIGNLSHLTTLDLSHNLFSGQIPSSIGNLYLLTILFLNANQFSGQIPSSIGNLSHLTTLDLSNNQFSGQIPSSIENFSHLTILYLNYNQFSGEIQLNDFLSYFKMLSTLDLSGNHVSITNKSSDPPLQLIQNLYLSGCGITELPELLRTQYELRYLDISNNKITGQVPGWLWTLPKLEYVNLSNNTFNGFERSTKPGIASVRKLSMVMHLFGYNNNFTGKIPSFICALRYLNTLDLSNNNFSGSIPRCMGNLESNLEFLNLRQNNLSGGIPVHIFETLRSLDVGHNQLVGELPRSLNRLSTLEVLNVENNKIKDTFPLWLSSLPELQVLVLRSNAFHGPIHQASFPMLRIIDISHNHFNETLPPEYFVKWSAMSSLGANKGQPNIEYMGEQYGSYYYDSVVLMNRGVALELVRILKIYTALDFSGNKLEGDIPKTIGLLKELHVLNLSNNAFTGHIPSSMGNLTALESLDVSQNKLSGEIPQELGNLSLLAYMNFSHNLLSGLVPGSTQFRRQNCSSFDNNMGLFGPSLDEDCRDIHTPASHQQNETPESEEEDEEVLSWIAAAIGFIPGIAFGSTIGYILGSYKPKWFMNPFGRNNRRRRSTTTH